MNVADPIEFIKLSSNPATPPSGFVGIFAKTDDKLYKITDAGVVTEIGARGATGATGSNGASPTPVLLTARRLFTATALADVTGLSFAVTNGHYYSGMFAVICQTTATATGIQLSLNGPTATGIAYTWKVPTSTTAESPSNRSAWNTGAATTGLTPQNTNFLAICRFQFKATAGGTLIVRMASETTSQVSAEIGSSGLLYDLGT